MGWTGWERQGFTTHMEAVKARNEMLEEVNPEDADRLEVDCYILKTGEMRYGVRFVEEDEE